MSQTKTGKKATPKPTKAAADPPEGPAAQTADVEPAQTAIGTRERALIARTARFLVNIQSPQYLGRAAKNGYTPEERAEGWRLWSTASGMDRPLEHWFTEQQIAESLDGISGDRLRILTALDTFENKWFPGIRFVIRRKVPRASRKQFEAAFFKNLEQQPLGPTVVGSVRGLLQRIKDLKKSKEPGAKDVLDLLVKRGLTEAKIKEIEALLKEAEEGSGKTPAKTPISPADLAAAQAAQFEACEDLRDWFNDIATQLRPAYNHREQVILGLAKARRRGPAGDDLAEDEELDAGEVDEEAEAADETARDEQETAPAKGKTAPIKPKGR